MSRPRPIALLMFLALTLTATSANPADGPVVTETSLPLALPLDLSDQLAAYNTDLILTRLGPKPADDLHLTYGLSLDLATPPCSTFKLPHALIALQTGVIADEHQTIRWDGVTRWADSWNRDHSLATAIPNSVLWFFEQTNRRIGPARMKTWLETLRYGNENTSNPQVFWLDGSLLITPAQQIDFISRLVRNDLPFDQRHIDTLKHCMIVAEGEGWTVLGKTGSGRPAPDQGLGWFIGYLERHPTPQDTAVSRPTGTANHPETYVFALRIRGDSAAWGPEARRLMLTILGDMQLIEADPAREAK